tara:strand:- start:8 stop:193 length:186 start_codon:yes stop_codon:yes gene_type:complete
MMYVGQEELRFLRGWRYGLSRNSNSTRFFLHKVPTIKYETNDLRLREVVGKEGIFLFENYE